MIKILVVDDQFSDRELCRDILEEVGFNIDIAPGGKEAIAILEKEKFNVVLTDLNMAEIDGLGIVRYVKEKNLDCEVIIMTAYATINTAVEAIQMGAYDYLTKPVDRNKLPTLINRCVEFHRIAEELRSLKDTAHLLDKKIEEKTKEIVSAQKKIYQMEKLAVMGQLAAGVAHQLRNPIQIVLSAAQYCIDKFKPSGELLDNLNLIVTTTDAQEKIVFDLLRATRFDELKIVDLSLKELLDSTVNLISNKCSQLGIKISSECPDSLMVKADNNYLQQSILNILMNSCEAMPKGGSIKIKSIESTSLKNSNDSMVKINYANIHIKDTGPGIPESIRQEIFQPFRTTKPRGTGLGLFFTYEVIVNQLAGEIQVKTEEGKGTEFILKIPSSTKPK